MNRNEQIRQNTGSWVRGELARRSKLEMAGLGICLGLLFAGWTELVLGLLFGQIQIWSFATIMVVAAVVYAFVQSLNHPSNKWNLKNLQKGSDAEDRVSQAINMAITAENCAVAHSVWEIASVGDIDHLVATPGAIWVIETKFKRVHPKAFQRVLSRIAANTKAVREWAPAGTNMRSCLVLAYEKKIKKRNYSHGGEEITAFTPELLRHEMSRSARGSRSLDEQIAKDIWKLGRISE